jgi:L-rhamnose mutarotase
VTPSAGNTRYCLALDLRNDPALIAEYCQEHERIWPEIAASIRDAGIMDMEIWRVGNRLFMIMETDVRFDASAKAIADANNPKVQEWEALMWRFQQPLPWASADEKWMAMDRVFDLRAQP